MTDPFYQLVLDSLPNQVAVVDRQGCTRFCNAAWRDHSEGVVAPEAEGLMREGRYLEACEAALRGDTGASAESLALMQVYLAALRNVISGVRAEFAMEYEVPGQDRWFRVRLARSRSGNGDTVIQRENITDLKRTEAALARQTADLKASELRLRTTVDSAGLGPYSADMRSGQVALGAGWCRLLGLPASDSQSTPEEYLTRVHPDDLARVGPEARRYALDSDAVFHLEYRLRHPSGSWIWVHDAGRVVERDAGGAPLRIVGVLSDITHRKAVEQESQRHAERLDLATGAAGIGVWDQDLRTGRSHWDARMRALFGIPPELPNEDIGNDLMARLCHPEDLDRLRTAIHAALAGTERFEAEFRVIRYDGGERHADVRALIHRDAQGSPVRIVGITMDVTERNRLIHERQQAQRLEAIGQLAAGIAHEINTPTQYIGDNTRFLRDAFAGLLGLLDRVRSNPPPTPEELQAAWEAADADYLREEIPRAIEQSLEGISRVAGIVRAMRDFSHPATERTPHDLNRAIQSTLAVATNEWKYVADIVTDFDPALPRVPVMPGEFNRMILNMVVNAAHAIAASRDAASTAKGRITLTTSFGGNHAIITIADNGCGMTAEVQERIFEPFFTTKGVGEGTGQGLAITRNFVVRHGGTISVESEPGKGAQFTIRLPLTSTAVPQPVA